MDCKKAAEEGGRYCLLAQKQCSFAVDRYFGLRFYGLLKIFSTDYTLNQYCQSKRYFRSDF